MNCELSIFNPEHDLALADGTSNYTPPRVARQLRKDLEWISSLWKDEGKVTVWGWDKAIVRELRQKGVPQELLPTEAQIDAIRTLSNRSLAVELLRELSDLEGVTGYSEVCHSYEEVVAFARKHGATIVKAPWSSSGRGVKQFAVHNSQCTVQNLKPFILNTIARQGTIVAEVKCDKVMDFALEYTADNQGRVHYEGLSLFNNVGEAYKGNLLMPEKEKRQMLAEYIPLDLMEMVSERIKKFLEPRLKDVYTGPFGVDMMVCSADSGYLLNPCVEINLRRTMGHVALYLTRQGHRGVMQIDYDGKKYELKITER